ncbi:transcription factor TFIIH complex subunit Tfb5 [Schizosaccharomyces pombe]|uniref:General transcription and DNA repair factor IIH subunit tfb5 n=1 Tax=Schizosaccharomyces pombe (strain 972 / ATCC 24843) TaxID=284812 RepID=TFB5_SCHPO|nr:putative transcription factor TFIIH complex subunit Tfb5 [Schizosaccharomyces pombe]Q9HDW3.1 RecName: Full=General transcription and DNA repair factor IIH subunit tfb5; Short=TFIIH subunit tfb5; AltName: Full=RNA polymerase II transcription factor B subunit 5 [Schizosaccharomyces pombe 972h-]CAC22107.1 transcription factor TFIIH complex subunit Tfb5 (predicted) [Schizosaccharomyces pombe]|eukprot:NP_596155.1 putative transcription factor TFIIH complex subunit Tfb5 [Schizosaccharomyces pombe]
MPRAQKGLLLVECDPTVKQLILNMDEQSPGIVIEEIDEERLLVNESRLEQVKAELERRLEENTYQVEE